MSPFTYFVDRRCLRVWVHVCRIQGGVLFDVEPPTWRLTERRAILEGRRRVNYHTRQWRRRQSYDAVYGLRRAA